MRTFRSSTIVLALGGCVLLGCSQPAGKSSGKESSTKANADAASHTADHPTKGPHGGALIELGEHEYHAELFHDSAKDEMVVVLMDKDAKQTVAIEAKEIVINLMHHGNPEQHKLTSRPQEKDPAGKSSRFVGINNPELDDDLGHDDAQARLSVTIAGKSYSGKISMASGHGASSHSHHDHDHAKEKSK